jgi:hypothetical protein
MMSRGARWCVGMWGRCYRLFRSRGKRAGDLSFRSPLVLELPVVSRANHLGFEMVRVHEREIRTPDR